MSYNSSDRGSFIFYLDITVEKIRFADIAFVDDMDLPVEEKSSLEVHNKLQEEDLLWTDRISAIGGTLRLEKCFWDMVYFDWVRGEWKFCTLHAIEAWAKVLVIKT